MRICRRLDGNLPAFFPSPRSREKEKAKQGTSELAKQVFSQNAATHKSAVLAATATYSIQSVCSAADSVANFSLQIAMSIQFVAQVYY